MQKHRYVSYEDAEEREEKRLVEVDEPSGRHAHVIRHCKQHVKISLQLRALRNFPVNIEHTQQNSFGFLSRGLEDQVKLYQLVLKVKEGMTHNEQARGLKI